MEYYSLRPGLIDSIYKGGDFMKNVLIGCGVVLLIVIIIGFYLCYHVIRFTKDVTVEMAEIEDQIVTLNMKNPFVPPDDSLIQSDRFGIWIALRLHLSDEVDQVNELFQDFSIKAIPNIRQELFDIAKLMVSELDTLSMSPNEYIWIVRQVIGVLDSGDGRQNPELKSVIEAFDSLEKTGPHVQSGKGFDEIGIPVTSRQIEKTIPILIQYRESLLQTVKVFYVDLILFPMMQKTAQEKSESQSV